MPEQASGATTDRPKLTKLLAAARAGRFDLVLVYRVDRFSRSVRSLAQLLDELDSGRGGLPFGHRALRHLRAPACGGQGDATQLNEHGHTTKNGKSWSRDAVLTVLRNRAYLGEVFFREVYYAESHPGLVDPDVFEAAQEILRARGEDHTKRAGNSSDYLMSGRIICPLCDKQYLGNAANGNKYRYRYYTCYSRLCCGKKTCSADRLPADQLEEAVVEALPATYERSDLATAEASIERYLRAFEAGTMPESVCGPWLTYLASTVAQLRRRESELTELCESSQEGAIEEEIDAMRTQIREAFANGNPATKKSLVQNLVAEVRITGPRWIQPVFRVPAGMNAEPTASAEKVRAMSGVAHPAGFEPAAAG